jgi:hypothetical protein
MYTEYENRESNMKRFLLFWLIAIGLTLPVTAQNQDVQSVIRDQNSAFAEDDFDAAFSFAGETIKQMFKTPEQFGRMVSTGYPMVIRPRNFDFVEQRGSGVEIQQYVLIEDEAGQLFLGEYQMMLSDGVWKITGVVIKPAPMVGT